MLKLTYSDRGLQWERLTANIEAWLAQRTVFAARLGNSVTIEPIQATFLVADRCFSQEEWRHLSQRESIEAVDIVRADEYYWEVSLSGTWLATPTDSHEGTFVTALPPIAENYLSELWDRTVCINEPFPTTILPL
jgi:hypothetical protein